MSANRNQTVTQTGNPEGAPRKWRLLNQLQMRRAGIEPATYSIRRIVEQTRSWFSSLTTRLKSVGILASEPRKGNRNRNANVTEVLGNGPSDRIRIVYSAAPFRPYSKEFRGELEAAVREDMRRLEVRRWN